LTVTVVPSVSVSGPPEPVLPWSFVVIETAAVPEAAAPGKFYVGL
jgi:hypothetical protein